MPPDEVTELDPEDNNDKLQIKVKEQNAMAVASFMMAFTTQGLMMLIHKSCDDDWAWWFGLESH